MLTAGKHLGRYIPIGPWHDEAATEGGFSLRVAPPLTPKGLKDRLGRTVRSLSFHFLTLSSSQQQPSAPTYSHPLSLTHIMATITLNSGNKMPLVRRSLRSDNTLSPQPLARPHR